VRWISLLILGGLTSLGVSPAVAQMPEGGLSEPPVVAPVLDIPSAAEGSEYFSSEAAANASTCDVPEVVDGAVACSTPDPIHGFLGYRYEVSSTEWMIGSGDQFGMFSFNWDHYKGAGVENGFGLGFQFHLLSGPIETDMPARLYDFSISYQHRERLGVFSYDVAGAVVASSDFEGSSREGIRFPGHVVGFLSLGLSTELVFGIDYLDRGDVKLLPVGGLIMVPHPDVRLEVVFPRPRAVFRLTGEHQLYVSGELGGSSWAIERAGTMVDDLATYRDLRLCIGIQTVDEDNDRTAVEIGYLFDRRLEYTSGSGDFFPGDTAMIRFVRTF
jgi:hypothetical protein